MEEREDLGERLNIKKAKIQFQNELEQYIEEEKIHDIFQEMMTSIIKERPSDPIQFLIDKLKKPEKKRIIIVTPPGMKGGNDAMDEEQYNVGLMLEQHLKELQGYDDIVCISVGDLLLKEITKKSEYGKRIYESRRNQTKSFSYIPDEIVIELVQKYIEEYERDKDEQGNGNSGWILEGFPRTRLQALALQQMKIIPDKFFMLEYPDQVAMDNLKLKMAQGATRVIPYSHEYSQDEIAKLAIAEYRVNIEGVKSQFNGNIIEIDGNKSKKKIVEEMARLLQLKESDAPKKPPRIIMMAPPGVDLIQHADYISQKYKLINIDIDQLIKDYIRREVENATDLRQMIKNGETVPDDTAIKLLRERLEMPDCKTNGWILRGVPTTIDQISMMKEMYQQPSLIILLDMNDDQIYELQEQRRFDPVTCKYHYILNENIQNQTILNRLVHKYEDQHINVKEKLQEFRGFIQNIMVEYQSQLVRVNAEQPLKDIHKNFVEAIELQI